MAIPRNINTLEVEKFKECPDEPGKPAVRTTMCGTAAFTPSGLRNGGKITIVSVSDSAWTALPASALANRNALSIQNRSDVEIKIQYDNTTVGYVGVAIPPKGERYYDITDAIVIYARSSSGTVDVTAEEIS